MTVATRTAPDSVVHLGSTYVHVVAPFSAPPVCDGDHLRCPKCGCTAPRGEWQALGRPSAYRDQLAEVYRCAACRHVFAPRPAQ